MNEAHGLLHRAHRRRHKRGQADQAHLLLTRHTQHLFRVDVAPKVQNAIPVVLQQHLDDILADVVDVALDRSDGDGARGGLGNVGLPHVRLHHVEAGLHRFRRRHQLRKEELPLVELVPHHVERRNEHPIDQLKRVVALKQGLRSRAHRAAAPRQNVMDQRLHVLFRVQKRLGHGNRASLGSSRGCHRGGTRRSRGPLIRIARVGIRGNKVDGAAILAVQHLERVHGIDVAAGLRIENGHVEAAAERGGQKRRVHHVALRKAEADVRDAEHRPHAQALLHHRDGAQDLERLALVGRASHGQTIDDHVGARDAIALGSSNDALGHGEAPLGRRRDAALVKRQADDRASVALDDGKHRLQAFLFAVHAIDERLAGVTAHRRLHGDGVGRVDHQRQGHRRGELVDGRREHLRLVEFGQTHVDVEDIGPMLLLHDGLPHQIVEIARTQRRLELRLSRRIDALADDGDVRAQGGKHHGLLGAAQNRRRLVRARHGLLCGHQRPKLGNVVGRRSAAAADDARARLDHLTHRTGEILRRHVEDRAPVLHMGKAGVGLHHQRAAVAGCHFLGGTHQLGRAQRAVESHGVRAHARKHFRRNLRRRPQKRASILAKRHGDEHGQVAMLACRQNRGLRLAQVSHGLDQHQIATACHDGVNLLREQVVRLAKGHGAHRLEQRADRADVAGNIGSARLTRAGCRGGVHVGDFRASLKLAGVRPEGVRGNDLGARGDVALVNGDDVVGIGEVQKLRDLSGIGESPLLQLRPHRTVDDEKFLAEQRATQMLVLDAQPRQVSCGAGMVQLGCSSFHQQDPSLVSRFIHGRLCPLRAARNTRAVDRPNRRRARRPLRGRARKGPRRP